METRPETFASWCAPPGSPARARSIRRCVIVHGLGGSDTSAYVLSTGPPPTRRGFHVLRANMRGAGDGEALCARLYNAGLDTDLLAVLAFAASRAASSRWWASRWAAT